jgi:hypothetical protein
MENKNMVRVMKAAIVEEDGVTAADNITFTVVVSVGGESLFGEQLSVRALFMLGSGMSTIGNSCLGGSVSVSGDLGLLGSLSL